MVRVVAYRTKGEFIVNISIRVRELVRWLLAKGEVGFVEGDVAGNRYLIRAVVSKLIGL